MLRAIRGMLRGSSPATTRVGATVLSNSLPSNTFACGAVRMHSMAGSIGGGAEAWTADAMRQDSDQWQLQLSSSQQQALRTAAGELKHRGVALEVSVQRLLPSLPQPPTIHLFSTNVCTRTCTTSHSPTPVRIHRRPGNNSRGCSKSMPFTGG